MKDPGDIRPPGAPSGQPPAGESSQPPGAPQPVTGIESFTRELRDGNLDRPMPFAEFMFQLGMAYDLPGRAEELRAAEARRRRTRRWLVALAVLVVAVSVLSQTVFVPRPESALPIDVVGEWRTPYPQYAGRAFTLAEDRVELDFGSMAARVEFPISEVRRSTVADTSVFEVFYRQDRGLTRFEFRYVEGAVPMIYLPNPIGVAWVRVQDLPAVAGAEPRPTKAVRPAIAQRPR